MSAMTPNSSTTGSPARQAAPRHRILRVLLPLFLFIFGCTPTPPPGVTANEATVAVLGEAYHLAPGSQASFLVQVRTPYQNQPQADRQVDVYLKGEDQPEQQVFSGRTGPDGIVNVTFAVPEQVDQPNQVLEIRADTDGGEYRTAQDVYLGRTYNVLLTTDKPVYQPGQVIHMRGLALDALDLHAADNLTMTLTVAGPQGDKLLRQALPTSSYGIAAADFPLDALAPSGDYTITAELGPTVSTHSVEVKPYTLPRFEVKFTPDRTFYQPGDQATGQVNARYFFGKPVANGSVSIRGVVNDGLRETAVVDLHGATDANGVFTYTFPIPTTLDFPNDYQALDVDVTVEVADAANHVEQIEETIKVAQHALLIQATPESGLLRPGLDNLVYLDVTYPDGVAAQAALTVTDPFSNTVFTAATDGYGLAAITLTNPTDGLTGLRVLADDGQGHVVEQPLVLGSDSAADGIAVLLRPDAAEHKVGDTLNVDIHVADSAPTVYLDIIKDRQSFGLVALPVTNGVAQAAIPIDGSLLGTLELNAYVTAPNGNIAIDRRYVLVNPAPADVTVRADRAVYRPGDTATLDVQVAHNGKPMPGAVGLSIVDESVYALEDQDPGFARTYFLLNRELQQKQYGLHDFVDLERDEPSPYDDAPDSIKYADAGQHAGQLAARQLALNGALAQALAEEAAQAPAQPVAAGAATSQPLLPWGSRFLLAAPLLGLALYDGSRNRRRLLIALVVFSLGAFFWSACAAPSQPPPSQPAPAAASTGPTATEQKPRLRQFFPETLYWMPELPTDDQGRLQVEVPIADSITTWRASLLVSDRQGNLGTAELGLRVFQDFFVEPDLPRFLTAGDEIDVPISVYNYLAEPQTITLSVQPADWYAVRGAPALRFEAGANEVLAAYLPIRVTQPGAHELEITAQGSRLSDAVRRSVEILPDGQRSVEVTGGRLQPTQSLTVAIPSAAIAGTGRVTFKVYPGLVSQVVAGLDGMLQEPYGCFEQTSSATYPNVLILDYLQRSGQASPRLALSARSLIDLGYQRLLTFEVGGKSGGFSLFGERPAQTMLTAYGLLEFSDMSKVAYVDPDLLNRMAEFLAGAQNSDGSWDPEGMTLESGQGELEDKIAATAYIAWGLADSGHANERAVTRALRYLDRALSQAGRPATASRPAQSKDAAPGSTGTVAVQAGSPQLSNYTLALIANAYVAAGKDPQPVLDRLLQSAESYKRFTYWRIPGYTYLGSYGLTADVETTALVAQALLRSGQAPDVAAQAIEYLIVNRDWRGSYHTTQPTVQALKALILAEPGAAAGNATIQVTLTAPNGKTSTQTIAVSQDNADLAQQVTFDDVAAGSTVSVAVTGAGQLPGRLQYQLVSEAYVPWQNAAAQAGAAAGTPLRLGVTYDRTTLNVGDLVAVNATVELLKPGKAGTILVSLGVPPGFAPLTEDLEALVKQGVIDRYELNGTQIVFYLTGVEGNKVYTMQYRLQARYPVNAQTPGSTVYDYYAPDQRAHAQPQRIEVTLATPGQ